MSAGDAGRLLSRCASAASTATTRLTVVAVVDMLAVRSEVSRDQSSATWALGNTAKQRTGQHNLSS